MDALETLVREALAEHAHEAPSGLAVPDGRGGRRWPYALLAAAVVAAVAVGIVLVRGGASHSSEPAAPTFPPVPPGMNEVSYHGITIQVSDRLRPGYTDCAGPRNEIITVDWTLAPSCPETIEMQPRRGWTLVRLAPYQNDRPDQPHMQDKSDVILRRNLPAPGVSVYIAAPSRQQALAIRDSIRITPVDRNGCIGTLPALQNQPAAELLPGAPIAASECSYTVVPSARQPAYLLRSLPVDPDRLGRLVDAIRGLPAGASGHSSELPGSVRYRFTYPDGNVRAIDVTRGDDATVTDGQHVAHDPDNAIANAFD